MRLNSGRRLGWPLRPDQSGCAARLMVARSPCRTKDGLRSRKPPLGRRPLRPVEAPKAIAQLEDKNVWAHAAFQAVTMDLRGNDGRCQTGCSTMRLRIRPQRGHISVSMWA